MANEGVLGKFHFGGEHAHTEDHPSVILSGKVKAGAAAMPAGMLLAMDSNGEIIPYAGADLIGVNDVPYTAGEEACIYLAHGTVKARMLVKTGDVAAVAADIQALNKVGIWPL